MLVYLSCCQIYNDLAKLAVWLARYHDGVAKVFVKDGLDFLDLNLDATAADNIIYASFDDKATIVVEFNYVICVQDVWIKVRGIDDQTFSFV